MKKRLVLSVLFMLAVFSTVFTNTGLAATLVYFPTDADTWSIASDPYMWHDGDYIEGTRDISVNTVYVDRIKVHAVLSYNVLSASGEVDIDVYLNNVLVGGFTVFANDDAVDAEFFFPPIELVDGLVTIKYLETNTVAPGAGSITIDDMESTVELSLQPVVGGEILPVNTVQILAPYFLILIVVVGIAGSLYKKRIP